MQDNKMASNTLLVAAIDFGTTFSGCAFSFKYEFEKDPTKVSTKNWIGDRVSLKGPTCILIKPDGKTVDSFGYEAENKYLELAGEEEHREWYFFRRFKMLLFDKEGLGRNELLKDECGKELPAKTVFSLSIKRLKDDLMSMSESRISGGGIRTSDIAWVLTVPAIWNDAAKQFMREAAQEAGIEEDMLTIALEPEAASLYCRHLPVEKCGGDKTSLASFGPGKRYLVLDAGGGTVDITVHEVVAGGNLKELHKASGGAWGGTKVDEAFVSFLTELIGSDGMKTLKEDHTEDFLDMMKDFEIKKREIDPQKQNKMSLKVPSSVREIVRDRYDQKMDERVKNTSYGSQVKFTGDKMRLEYSVANSFFQPSIESILNHVESLLKESQSQGVEAVLMVGGFSESLILQGAVRGKFPGQKIIIPDEPGLAVLKGAVIYGHKPTAITERVSKYTYGTDAYNPLRMLLDTLLSKREEEPTRYLKTFSELVKAGQTLVIGESQEEHTFTTTREDQTQMGMDIYATLNEEPRFVDEPGCHKIGQFTVPVSGRGKDREVKVKMIFGGTEIIVECLDVGAKRVTHLKVDFLS